MDKALPKARLIELLKEAGESFKLCSRRCKILAALAWPPAVAVEFFRKKEGELPRPKYAIDREGLQDAKQSLARLRGRFQGEHPVLKWLSRVRDSFEMGIRLLESTETSAFYEISSQLYGNSSTRLFNGQSSNLELATAIASRMAVSGLNGPCEPAPRLSAGQFALELERRLGARNPPLPVRIEVTDQIVAKVVAGMSRVRVRKDARFSELELSSIWDHEIESHCLTAHNGARQSTCDFLCAGGPRTTMTQEGLAVFYEVYGHTISQRRFLALCHRTLAVQRVEAGADFMELYRWYKESSDSPLDAFYNAQRIFRGAQLSGRAPFTKDVVYLAGLVGIHNFLRIAVKSQNRLLVESLVCGRIALEDVAIIAWLRAHGIASSPFYIPGWLRNWEALLSSFSLSAVLASADLPGFQGYFDEHNTLESWDLSL